MKLLCRVNVFPKVLLFICFMFCFAGSISQINAQGNDKRIDEIKKIYKQVNEQIAEAEKHFAESDIYFTELVVNKGGTMYPAVGNFKQVIKFYYTFGDREQNPYPNRLLKIVVSTERAARKEYAEYLFNTSGQLVFYFEKDDETESRFYFSMEKIIRLQRGERVVNFNNREEMNAPKAVLAQKNKLVQIFRNSNE